MMYKVAFVFVAIQETNALPSRRKLMLLSSLVFIPFFIAQYSSYNKDCPDQISFADFHLPIRTNSETKLDKKLWPVQNSSSRRREFPLGPVKHYLQTDSLATELKRATLIVKGKVVEAGIEDKGLPKAISEHDPDLRCAIIEPRSVLKGTDRAKRIKVYYAASEDVLWYDSPKLARGQEAVFLLQTNQSPAIFPLRHYTILNKLDVQPIAQLPKLKTWMKQFR